MRPGFKSRAHTDLRAIAQAQQDIAFLALDSMAAAAGQIASADEPVRTAVERGSCQSEDMAVENSPGSPSKQDPRQRVAVPLFRAIGPLMRLVLRHGLPAGPNAF